MRSISYKSPFPHSLIDSLAHSLTLPSVWHVSAIEKRFLFSSSAIPYNPYPLQKDHLAWHGSGIYLSYLLCPLFHPFLSLSSQLGILVCHIRAPFFCIHRSVTHIYPHLDAWWPHGVVGVAEPELAPLVAAEGEEPARGGDHSRVLVTARDQEDLGQENVLYTCRVALWEFIRVEPTILQLKNRWVEQTPKP